MRISVDQFKDALSCWASGVSVVTTVDKGMLYGLTVSSFSSVSLDPPLVMVCLANSNRIVEMIEQGGGFAVSILGTDQVSASNYFARPGRLPTPEFTEIEGAWAPTGHPVVGGALAWIACELHEALPAGDHTIMIGLVVDGATREGEPLLYFNRGYRTVAELDYSKK